MAVQVNAALLAPETRAMMIGYAETIMAQGAPVKTYGDLVGLMHGRWKLAFTTEDRYRALPPGKEGLQAGGGEWGKQAGRQPSAWRTYTPLCLSWSSHQPPTSSMTSTTTVGSSTRSR